MDSVTISPLWRVAYKRGLPLGYRPPTKRGLDRDLHGKQKTEWRITSINPHFHIDRQQHEHGLTKERILSFFVSLHCIIVSPSLSLRCRATGSDNNPAHSCATKEENALALAKERRCGKYVPWSHLRQNGFYDKYVLYCTAQFTFQSFLEPWRGTISLFVASPPIPFSSFFVQEMIHASCGDFFCVRHAPIGFDSLFFLRVKMEQCKKAT
mmetsp:Transcript_3255/g.7209  ORF Transcript_3255/g.7209 Transcript_3255/m.7209 type:complete len:210 (-) Transcript_3255:838-1467(-)